MKKILSAEDKKYLRFICKYLMSYGEKTGTLRIDDWNPGYSEIHGWGGHRFDENYYLEIPDRLIPIYQKISSGISDFDPEYESDDIGSTWISLVIDAEAESIHAEFCYSYYTRDEQGMSWDESEIAEDESLSKIMDELSKSDIKTMWVKFDGNGDSGSIEQAEDEDGNTMDVPADVEEWCYEQLESNYGGWEINEGSNGSFIFKIESKEVILDFAWNNENTECDTIYEEKFDK
jgi:hypothetical protein